MSFKMGVSPSFDAALSSSKCDAVDASKQMMA